MTPQILPAGGTLAYQPSQSIGVASARVTVRGSSGVVLVDDEEATVDLATTTSADAAEGDGELALTDNGAVIVRGRSYLLSNGITIPEWVRVRGLDATTVYLDALLVRDYPSGSWLGSNLLTYAWVPTSDLDRGTYECSWTFEDEDGNEYTEQSYVDVVRTLIPVPILRADHLRALLGSLADDVRQSEAQAGDDFEDCSLAAQDDVLTDIRQRGIEPGLIRSWPAFRKPIAFRIVLNRAQNDEGVPKGYAENVAGWIDLRRTLYEGALTEALATCGTYDADDDGTVSTPEKKANHGIIWVTR